MKVSWQFYFDMNRIEDNIICEEGSNAWKNTIGTIVDDNDYITVDEFLMYYRSLRTKDKFIKGFYDTIENDDPDKFKQYVENASEFMKALSDKGVTEDFIAEEIFAIYPKDIKELVTTKDEDIIDEAEDTITILNTYVDNLEIKNDKLDLTALLRKLYDEALQVS